MSMHSHVTAAPVKESQARESQQGEILTGSEDMLLQMTLLTLRPTSCESRRGGQIQRALSQH
jgi:hypothetical protein